MNFAIQFLSYIFPIRLEKSITKSNLQLFLMLNKGRLQLGTKDAIYSWEDLYYPFQIAFDKNFEKIKDAKSCLIIGLGMGSIVSILNKKMNLKSIQFTGIEKEEPIVNWVKKYEQLIADCSINIIHNDAENITMIKNQKFDLIAIDVFQNRSVPAFIQSRKYLSVCSQMLNDSGVLFLNIIVQDAEKLTNENFEINFKSIFIKHQIIYLKANQVWIGEK